MVNMDSYLYGKLVVAPWNIVKYNVFGSGSQLYGTEPLSYYLLNGFLNFNVAFVASFFALPLAVSIRAIRIIQLSFNTEGYVFKYNTFFFHFEYTGHRKLFQKERKSR